MSFHQAGGGGGTASSRMRSNSSSSKSSKSSAHRRLVHLARYMCIVLRPAAIDRQSGRVKVHVDIDHLRSSYSPVPLFALSCLLFVS